MTFPDEVVKLAYIHIPHESSNGYEHCTCNLHNNKDDIAMDAFLFRTRRNNTRPNHIW